jgi:CheY-like chemotaxis protein
MKKNVLNVGQCGPDDSSIRRLIENQFPATVSSADTQRQAFEMALQNSYDLILINRILDADGSEGMQLLRDLKADPRTQSIPVMLVSNYHQVQQAAIAEGALPGFGKATLNTEATTEELGKILN